MQILGLLGMYFDAVVVEVEKYLLLFRLALAILWVLGMCHKPALKRQKKCWLNLFTFLRVRSTVHVISCRHVLA